MKLYKSMPPSSSSFLDSFFLLCWIQRALKTRSNRQNTVKPISFFNLHSFSISETPHIRHGSCPWRASTPQHQRYPTWINVNPQILPQNLRPRNPNPNIPSLLRHPRTFPLHTTHRSSAQPMDFLRRRLQLLLPRLPLRLLSPLHRRRRLHRRLSLHFEARFFHLNDLSYPPRPESTLRHFHLGLSLDAHLLHRVLDLLGLSFLLVASNLRSLLGSSRLHDGSVAFSQRGLCSWAGLRFRRHEEELRLAKREDLYGLCGGFHLSRSLWIRFWSFR